MKFFDFCLWKITIKHENCNIKVAKMKYTSFMS